MPTYVFRCETCNVEEDAWVAVEQRDNPRLHSCGQPMKRLPFVLNDFRSRQFFFLLRCSGLPLLLNTFSHLRSKLEPLLR